MDSMLLLSKMVITVSKNGKNDEFKVSFLRLAKLAVKTHHF